MEIRQIMYVPHDVAEEMTKLCNEVCDGVKKDGQEFDEEVIIPIPPRRVAIQVCSSTEPTNEPCWTQAVLFDMEGTELDCSETGESFLGEYHLEHDGTEFVVDVQDLGDVRPYSTNEKYQGFANPLTGQQPMPRWHYIRRLIGLDDKQLEDEAKQKIWLSAYASNNPRSDYHWHVDACYVECSFRKKLDIYERAYKRAGGP